MGISFHNFCREKVVKSLEVNGFLAEGNNNYSLGGYKCCLGNVDGFPYITTLLKGDKQESQIEEILKRKIK